MLVGFYEVVAVASVAIKTRAGLFFRVSRALRAPAAIRVEVAGDVTAVDVTAFTIGAHQ